MRLGERKHEIELSFESFGFTYKYGQSALRSLSLVLKITKISIGIWALSIISAFTSFHENESKS